jgi:diguanylate cyclase (GGDEF)-like protein
MSKPLFHFLLPGGALALIALLVFLFQIDAPKVEGFLPYYPVIVLLGGLFIGWRFNRSRLVFVLFVLTAAKLTLDGFATPVPADGSPLVITDAEKLVVAAIAGLFPLNLAFFASCQERGFLTWQGKVRAGFIGVQILFVGVFLKTDLEGALSFFTRPWLNWPPLLHLPLSQFAILVFLFTACYLLLRFVNKPVAFEAAFFWALLVVIIPLAFSVRGENLTFWLATAGLIMTVGTLEASHSMAFRDELTGLPARRALSEELLKIGKNYTIAMVDVDHFKKVNDTYGHDVGDQVLKMVAARLEYVTGGGRAFRYGGEEFTVLFPNRSLREVKPHLEALREAIGKASFTVRDKNRPEVRPEGQPKAPAKAPAPDVQLSVTVSIGVCQRGERHSTFEEVIKAADKALYKAKEGGRNRVCLG